MTTRQSIRLVPLSKIDANPANIRENLGDLTELTLSIREHGLLQPLVVTDDFGDRLLLLGGHRRAAAARLAGLTQVPVVIRHGLSTDDIEQLVVMVVENCQRADLNPIEKAEALGDLVDHGLAQSEIARRTGLSLATVSRSLGLLKLPLSERQAIKAGHRSAQSAIVTAREQRQDERARAAGRPVGRPKGRTSTPYFSLAHPLAKAAAETCTHKQGRVKVGGVACGPCWEQTIRNDALGTGTP